MTKYNFFHYTGCFWRHYVELTQINKADERYEKCIVCNGDLNNDCKNKFDSKKLEHILTEIREKRFK